MSKGKTKSSKDERSINTKMNKVEHEIKKDSKKKSSSRPRKSGDMKSDFISSTGKPTNDPRWYLNNPTLTRDVGSIWFSKPVGGLLPRSSIASPQPTTVTMDQFEPGILSIPTMTTWGTTNPISNAQQLNDPINLTAQKLYQFVVHANSRNISYDKKDLMMTIMAIDGVYQIITDAIRAYRLIAQYDPENRYVSKLLTAMNWDVDTLKANVSEFRYQINYAITRVNKFFVPAIFDIIKAHLACYEHIYADRPSNKAQFIVKYPHGFWLYDDANGDLNYYSMYPVAGGIILDYTGATKRTLSTFVKTVETQIAAIENAQYLGVMQGDLLKAFGRERMMQYAYIGIDMPIAPVYDEEFNLKLHNADISFWDNGYATVGGVQSAHSLMVYRDDNNVTGNFSTLLADNPGPSGLGYWRDREGVMVDLPTHIPASSENILLMCLHKLSRYDSISDKWRLTDATANTYFRGYLPPEVLMRAKLYYDPEDMTKAVQIHSWAQSSAVMAFLSRFHDVPLITEENINDGDQLPIFWNTDNVSAISLQSIERMFEVVYWSLWASSEITSTVSREDRE